MLKKNNNKGYFLTEVIIVITIVAIAITVLYVNSMTTYIKQDNELTKFNTTEGLYSAGEIKSYFENQQANFKNEVNSSNYLDVFNYYEAAGSSIEKSFFNSLNVKTIYFTKYKIDSFIDSITIVPSIKKDLKLLKYDENLCDYRYIIIFNDNSYSTIGVDCYE